MYQVCMLYLADAGDVRRQVKRIQDVSSRCQQTLDRYLPRIAQARQLTPQQLGTLAEFDASDAQYVGLDHQETVQHAGKSRLFRLLEP